MENKNMLQNHSVVDHGAYLTLTLGDDEIVVTTKHLDTLNELCEYLDCINLMIPLVADQSDCLCKQDEKIAKLDAENKELYKKLDELITEKTKLNHTIEAYKDANARLQEQVKQLTAEKQCIEDVNDFNEQCRKMHMDAIRKDLDEAVAKNKAMSIMIDDYQNRINNQESLIKRLRAVAERTAKEGFEVAHKLVDLKSQLRDVHDWIETVVDPEDDE